MKISLLTDAPTHNFALMQLSAYHKARGDEVTLNMPLLGRDLTYASILFRENKDRFVADEYGGPGFAPDASEIPLEAQRLKPDYKLFSIDYSLGYTYRACPRRCPFCVVPRIEKDRAHRSIWDFHDPRFKRICLLNNSTFADPRWKETFEEIWEAKLIVIDENGYDLRLIDQEKAEALKRTKWDKHSPRFAWDRMEDESEIIRGLEEIKRVGFRRCMVYVLTGFDTTIEEDIYRCQRIHDLGFDPYPMIYENNHLLNEFRKMIYSRSYRKSGNVEKAWKERLGVLPEDRLTINLFEGGYHGRIA